MGIFGALDLQVDMVCVGLLTVDYSFAVDGFWHVPIYKNIGLGEVNNGDASWFGVFG